MQDCEDKLVARNSAMADEASILTVLDAFQVGQKITLNNS